MKLQTSRYLSWSTPWWGTTLARTLRRRGVIWTLTDLAGFRSPAAWVFLSLAIVAGFVIGWRGGGPGGEGWHGAYALAAILAAVAEGLILFNNLAEAVLQGTTIRDGGLEFIRGRSRTEILRPALLSATCVERGRFRFLQVVVRGGRIRMLLPDNVTSLEIRSRLARISFGLS